MNKEAFIRGFEKRADEVTNALSNASANWSPEYIKGRTAWLEMLKDSPNELVKSLAYQGLGLPQPVAPIPPELMGKSEAIDYLFKTLPSLQALNK